MSKRTDPPLDRRNPKNQTPPKITPKPIRPSDDTSGEYMPKGWRRGLIPLDRQRKK